MLDDRHSNNPATAIFLGFYAPMREYLLPLVQKPDGFHPSLLIREAPM